MACVSRGDCENEKRANAFGAAVGVVGKRVYADIDVL